MAVTLEELQIKFTAEMGNLNSELNGIKQAIGGIEEPTKKAHTAFSGLAKIGGMLAGAAIGAKLIQIGNESIQMANAVTESESLFEVSMKGMAGEARAWSKDLAGALGLSEFELRKNVGLLNTMFTSLGLTQSAAYDMATGMTELANDMASFYNLPTEEAFTKLRAGIMGETEPLRQLGIIVDENTTKHYALANGIIKEGEEMNAQQKVMARYGLILQQTTDAQGDLARTLDSPTNQMRQLGVQVDNAKIALGQALQPVLLAVIPILIDLAKGAVDFIRGLGMIGEAIGKVVTDAGLFCQQIGKFFSDTWNSIKDIWGTVSAWFSTTVIEPTKTFFSNAFGNILLFVKSTWDGIVSAWSSASGWFNSSVVEPIKRFFSDGFGTITSLVNGAVEAVMNAWSGLSSWFNTNIITPIRDAWNGLMSFLGIKKTVNVEYNVHKNVYTNQITEGELPEQIGEFSGYARGGVFKANKPILGLLGDQKSGVNIETPENLLRQIFRDEVSGVSSVPTYDGADSSSMLRQAIEGVMDRLNVNLIVDGQTFGKATIKAINTVQRNAGTVLLEM